MVEIEEEIVTENIVQLGGIGGVGGVGKVGKGLRGKELSTLIEYEPITEKKKNNWSMYSIGLLLAFTSVILYFIFRKRKQSRNVINVRVVVPPQKGWF